MLLFLLKKNTTIWLLSPCQSFPKNLLQREGSKVGSIKSLTNCFLWERSLIFLPFLSFITLHSSLCASPFSPLLPNHINSLHPSPLNIHSHYFSHAYSIFISFTSITLPLFPPAVFQSCLSPPLPILLLPFSPPLPLSLVFLSLSDVRSQSSLLLALSSHFSHNPIP